MAALEFTGLVSEVASGTTTLTLVQLVAPANHLVRVLDYTVSFKGTNATAEPIEVQLLRQTTAGTSAALTLVKNNDSIAETILTTALKTFTAEPTAGDILDVEYVHPQGGSKTFVAPSPDCWIIGGGDRVGIRVVTPGATVKVAVRIRAEE